MRIGLDARTLIATRPRGTGRNLLDTYRVLPALRPDWEFILYHQRPLDDAGDVEAPPWKLPNVRLRQIDLPGDRFDVWFQVRLPLAAREDGVHLLHCPANAAPRWRPVRCVTTVHDLAPLTVPGEASRAEQAAFRRGLLRAISGTSVVITPSEATRDELCRQFKVTGERVAIVPWAPDSRITATADTPISETERQRVRDTFGLDQQYFLSFAGDVRRKNAEGLIQALATLAAAERAGVQVAFVGITRPARRAELEQLAASLGVAPACRLLSFVPYEDLPTLVRASAGVLIPSLAEGFGLPVLDAFACGVPVVASRCPSLVEVADDAAEYCDAHDPATIASAIQALREPRRAAELVARGRKRVAHFSWLATAQAMLRAYERALGIADPATPTAQEVRIA